MSVAIKCDRCKTTFDPWTAKGIFGKIIDYSEKTSENYRNNEVCYRDEELDLCPKCAKEFSRFMCVPGELVDIKLLNDCQEDLDATLYEKSILRRQLEDIRQAAKDMLIGFMTEKEKEIIGDEEITYEGLLAAINKRGDRSGEYRDCYNLFRAIFDHDTGAERVTTDRDEFSPFRPSAVRNGEQAERKIKSEEISKC